MEKKTDHVFRKIKDLSSAEIRQLLGTDSFDNLCSLAKTEDLSINTYCVRQLKKTVKAIQENSIQPTFPSLNLDNQLFDPLTVTFKGGAKEPFVRWYPYLEGYSPKFVEKILTKYAPNSQIILDPFAGTATTAFTASQMNKKTYFCEINPVLQFASMQKIRVRRSKPAYRKELAQQLHEISRKLLNLSNYERDYSLYKSYINTFNNSVFFDEIVFDQILRIRTWVDLVSLTNPMLANLFTIAILAALVPASRMKRSGDLRYKRLKELNNIIPFTDAIKDNLKRISNDLISDVNGLQIDPIFICENVQSLEYIPNLKIDTVVTSPPYVNGTNYFRNTKLELWFLRCLRSKNDLSRFRNAALTAGINDVTVGKVPHNLPFPIRGIVKKLEKESYDSRIPRMIACYFNEITDAFKAVSRHLIYDATIAIDIGDSSYANIYVPVDKLLSECLSEIGYKQENNTVLRKRRSRNGMPLKQVLIIYKYHPKQSTLYTNRVIQPWISEWNDFKHNLPHQKTPYSKRNWGHARHSLCSYPGKLKPSIAHHLVNIFVPENGTILDPFTGVGTIPFEAALQGKTSYGFDISPAAFIIASAKLNQPDLKKCNDLINYLEEFITNNIVTEKELNEAGKFGFNGKLIDYYEPNTLNEIILARRYFQIYPPETPEAFFILASLLHILHGNRPYALSRQSHPITPYKPKGPYEYRSLIGKLSSKVKRGLDAALPSSFKPGKIFLRDATIWWPQEIDNLDAIITSPPFFDSTRYYLANWLRLWFTGWEQQDFKLQPLGFVDERQKQDFSVYIPVIRQAKERLKPNGVLIFHLGKSIKCDMANELMKISKTWFKSADVFNENVEHCENHGVRDKGTVTSHQYLVLH